MPSWLEWLDLQVVLMVLSVIEFIYKNGHQKNQTKMMTWWNGTSQLHMQSRNKLGSSWLLRVTASFQGKKELYALASDKQIVNNIANVSNIKITPQCSIREIKGNIQLSPHHVWQPAWQRKKKWHINMRLFLPTCNLKHGLPCSLGWTCISGSTSLGGLIREWVLWVRNISEEEIT